MSDFGNFCSVFRRRADAVAFLKGSEKYDGISGSALFYAVRGGVIVRVEVTGLPKGTKPCGNPVFAFHIHSGGSCTGNEKDAFADADGHYNPNNCLHPYHAGDMPPLFGANGNALSVFLTDRVTVPEIIGRTVIIHLSPDDFTTQPAGNAGEKIACGVIRSIPRQQGPYQNA